MLDKLVAVYPDSLSREEPETRAGFTASGGTFGTYLGTLRRNGLVEVDDDQVRASETLFKVWGIALLLRFILVVNLVVVLLNIHLIFLDSWS